MIHSNAKQWILISVVLFVAFSFGIFYWTNREPANTMHTIGSKDGAATVTIPESALPNGVSAGDISIAKLTPDEYPKALGSLAPIAVYRLEPEGTKFLEPVSFSMTLDAGKLKAWPIMIHVSKDSVESAAGSEIKKQKDGSFIMTGSIQHFSFIGGVDGFVEMEMPKLLGRHKVGESFSAPVTFNVVDRVYGADDASGDYWQLTSRPKFMEPGGTFFASDALEPRKFNTPPKGTELAAGKTEIQGQFTCVKSGYATIRYVTGIDYDYEFYLTGAWRPLNVVTFLAIDHLGGGAFSEEAFLECYDTSVNELRDKFQFDANTWCDGRVEINGKLQQEQVTALKFALSPGGSIVSQEFNPASGVFHLVLQVPVGQFYRLKVTAITASGEEIFVSDPGFSVPKCPEDYTPKKTDTTPKPPPKTDGFIIPWSGDISPSFPLDVKIGTDTPAPSDIPEDDATIPETPPENTDGEDSPITTPAPLDICCLNPTAPVGERYYIPFDGSGCLPGDQQVPLDKDCGNPLLY